MNSGPIVQSFAAAEVKILKPISRTAFYCTGVRALDARHPHPVCGDQYAERFMDDAAWTTFAPFRSFTAPNISNATRHRIIDDLLRERLAARPELPVFIIGAGFDTRAFRLPGGRWLEIDEPQIFAWKEPRLPAAGCPNPLTRLAVDFENERLADRLAPYATGERAVVVVEGVLFYLPSEAVRELLRAVRALWPNAEIICDIMTAEFFNRFGRRVFDKVHELGAAFVLPERPLADVIAAEGYRETAMISTTAHPEALARMPWIMRLFTRLMPPFQSGYTIRVFVPEPIAPASSVPAQRQ